LIEGLIITKHKETAADVQSYICPNPSCGKSFAKPLKAVNLSMENPEPYLACPNCLTEVTLQEKPLVAETNLGLETEALKPSKESLEKENAAPHSAKTTGCTHHFGYLSERSSKEKIPEECMNCAEIVNCMLKAVKSSTNN
jgi:hypothetical protein